MNILVPLDGTRHSGAALPWIPALFGSGGHRITLATVAGEDRSGPLERYLAKSARWLAERKVAGVETTVLTGKPSEALLSFARRAEAGIILLCSERKTGLSRLVLGSVTEDVIRGGAAPVLVVPPGAGTRPPSLKRILVPLDGSHRSDEALKAALALARLVDARIALLYVVSSSASRGEMPAALAAKNLARDQAEAGRRGVAADVHLVHGVPAKEIPAFASVHGFDLVAMATHGRSGVERLRYGSVAEAVLRGSRLPMLLVRAAAQVREHVPAGRSAGARRSALSIAKDAGRMPLQPFTH